MRVVNQDDARINNIHFLAYSWVLRRVSCGPFKPGLLRVGVSFVMLLFGEPLCSNVSAPVALSYNTLAISVLLCLVTVPGNLLVLLAVSIDPYKELKCPFNYFILNLAIADLIAGLIVEPISIVFHVKEITGSLDEYIWIVLHMSYFITSTASVLSLAALAVERYLVVQYEMKYRTEFHLKPVRVLVVSLAIWIFSLSFPITYFKIGYMGYSFVFNHTTVVLTFVVLIFTYTRIFKKLHIRVREWDSIVDTMRENQAKRQAVRDQQKITKTLMIMLASFALCYLPPLPLTYIMNFCSSCSCNVIHVARDLQITFILANSSLNPFVFAWRSEKFRRAFVCIVRCRKLEDRKPSLSVQIVSNTPQQH